MSVYRVLVFKNGKSFRNLRIVKRGGYQRGAPEDGWSERDADEGFEEVLLAQLEIEAAPDRNKDVVPVKVQRVRVRGPWAAGGRRKAGV
jgi:hypothetical protein